MRHPQDVEDGRERPAPAAFRADRASPIPRATLPAGAPRHAETRHHKAFTPSSTAPISRGQHGFRAKCLQRLIRWTCRCRARWRCPSTRCRHRGRLPGPDGRAALAGSTQTRRWCRRPPAGRIPPGAGRRGAQHRHERRALAAMIDSLGRGGGRRALPALRQAYAVHVAHLDAALFDPRADGDAAVTAALRAYEAETEEPFPQDPASCARCCGRWRGRGKAPRPGCCARPRARPRMRGSGLSCRKWRLGWAHGESGAGCIQFIDPVTGAPGHRALPEPEPGSRGACSGARGRCS